ncbi:MAG: EexN family lipoprotein [Desulfovibrio sp.]|uniref:EexN family lipoprotein n=1 Tax=Desulfovibrio sp. TaxID=885 RepID=UPI002589F899|nr:EexN family lipoprotein [Desulfovibrio sp.]MCD7982739.1 EexN family lipoprotein [Desulfovibrio sp.]
MVNKLCLSALVSGALLLLAAPFALADETRTVDWYTAPQNKAALDAKLAECRNNPGELHNTPNCFNARAASEKLATSGHFEKVKEPPIPTFARPMNE